MTKKGWIPGCAMRQRNHPNCFLSQGDSVNHEKLRRGSIWRFRPIATRGVRLSDVPRPRRALSSLEDRDLHLGTRSAQAGWVSFLDRKSTRLNSVTNAHLVCRLLLEKKKKTSNTLVQIH